MAITLPTYPAPADAQALLIDFGGVLTPFMGGPVQGIGRLGTRLGLRVTMPPLRGTVARQWQGRLPRGKRERVILEWPLLDMTPAAAPGAAISTASAGTALALKGLPAGYVVNEGQPISVVSGGRRYMHFITGNAAANGSGLAAVGVFPPTRVTYAADDAVEINAPKIEGLVSPGDELSWSYALEHTMGFAFTIVETK